ncbi:unnamed protein product [Caenorhabditis angaria]|uniref:Major sperm protein n=1 Tax=Caenorhabditis angaria TaxID=860376 RepID=A0A9P1I658_9PELO|nr:unnamed protein product [Caenorhabditis angaria]
MSEKRNLLQISPARELLFTGPFTDVVTSVMTLKNPTSEAVCFKVKTTAPKQYCVRPNSGLLQPGDTKEVTVMLQPLDGIPSDANRHKFMVQACIAPSADLSDLESVWKMPNPPETTYNKLMVVFVDKEGNHENRSSVTSGGQVEDTYTSVQTQDLHATHSSSNDSGTVASLRKSLKTAVEEKDGLLKQVQNLQQEVEVLLKKNRNLQMSQGDAAGASANTFPTLQQILLAFAILLIGLIFGRIL